MTKSKEHERNRQKHGRKHQTPCADKKESVEHPSLGLQLAIAFEG